MTGFSMMRLAAMAATLALLAGCTEPMIKDSDVIRHATEPAFGYDERGQIQPTSCRSDRPSTYSGTPSACARDVVFAKQVFDPVDLVNPRRPGPAPAAPLGRAADSYINGNVVTPTGGYVPVMPGGGPGAAQVVVPATAGMVPGPGY